MTIKLILLKSGEDIISDISEMTVGEGDNRTVIGYFLNKPCVVKMRNPSLINEDSESKCKKTGFEVSLFPWMPLSKEERIPITAEWLITMLEPVDKLKQMYITEVISDGEDYQNTGADEQSDSDQ